MAIKLNRKGVGLSGEERNKENQNLEMIEQEFAKIGEVVPVADDAKKTAAAAEQKATAAVEKADNVQAQFNKVVVEGDSSPAAAQAAVDAHGVDQGNLKKRLDKDYNELNQQLVDTKAQLNLSLPYLANFFKALERALAGGSPVVVAFMGDSVTAANEPNNFYSHPEYLQAWFDTKYGAGIVTVVNAGNGGHDARMMNTRIARDVMNKEPDVVILNSGWNDIGLGHLNTYEHYMNRMADLVRKTTKKPIDLVFRTTNIGTSNNMQTLRDVVTPALYRIAKRHQAQVFDLLGIMDKDVKEGKLEISNILADDKHPNSVGQSYIANQFKPLFDDAVKLTKQSEAPQFVEVMEYVPASDSRVANAGFATLSEVVTNSYHPYGKALAASSYAARSASMKFYGRTVGISVLMGEFTGQLGVTIDGVSVGTIDTYEKQDNGTFNRNLRNFYFGGLTEDEHTIVVSHLSTKNAASTGTSAYIHGFLVEKNMAGYYKAAGNDPKHEYKAYYNAVDKTTKVDVVERNGALVIPFDRIVKNSGASSAVTNSGVAVENSGLYHILGSVKLTANFPIDGKMVIRVNGSNRQEIAINYSQPGTVDRTYQITNVLRLEKGDIVTLVVYSQNAIGQNLSVKYDNLNNTFLQVSRII